MKFTKLDANTNLVLFFLLALLALLAFLLFTYFVVVLSVDDDFSDGFVDESFDVVLLSDFDDVVLSVVFLSVSDGTVKPILLAMYVVMSSAS